MSCCHPCRDKRSLETVVKDMVREFMKRSVYIAWIISRLRRQRDTDVLSHDNGVCIPGYNILFQSVVE